MPRQAILRQCLFADSTDFVRGDYGSVSVTAVAAQACQRFFGPGYGPCDPMVIMDAMEEEIERRDLRGDFLPFELARKALLVLQRRWQGPRRPSQFLQPKENRLDVVNFEKLPKPK